MKKQLRRNYMVVLASPVRILNRARIHIPAVVVPVSVDDTSRFYTKNRLCRYPLIILRAESYLGH